MAKTTAPLFGFGASGTLAKAIVFSKWKGRPYARRHVIPANPQSTAQTLTRDVFSTATAIWKIAPTLFIEAWDRFATGQVLTGRNGFTGRFVSVLRAASDLTTMVFSPGAKGGLPPLTTAVVAGSTQLEVTVTVPAPPSGWTLTSVICAVIRDGAPATTTLYEVTAGEDVSSPYVVTLTGLTASVLYIVGAWTKWAKPDGSVAYGPSILDSGTPTA
jgi:hypothetical protein